MEGHELKDYIHEVKSSSLVLLTAFITSLALSGCVTLMVTGGTFELNGSSNSTNFSNYSISWGSGWNPSSWNTLGISLEGNGLNPIEESILASLNLSSLNDTNITIRLRTYDNQGRYSDDYAYVMIDNIWISSPATEDYIEGGTSINITGRAMSTNFGNYTILLVNYSESGNASEKYSQNITLENSGNTQIDNALLGQWDTPIVQQYTDYTIYLQVNKTDGSIDQDSIDVCILPIDQYEPDNNYTDAKYIISAASGQQRSFMDYADMDYVKFDTLQGFIYQFETINLTDETDTLLTLYSVDGITPLAAADGNRTLVRPTLLRWYAPSTDTYYLKATDYSPGQKGGYILKMEKTDLSLDAYEPDNNASNASWISVNSSQQHNLLINGDADYAKFNITQGLFYDLSISGYTDTYQQLVLQADDGTNQTPESKINLDYNISITWRANTSGTLYGKVILENNDSGENYTITFASKNMTVDSYEPDGNASTANWITTDGTWQDHNLYEIDDIDYVKFNATANRTYRIHTFRLDQDFHTDTVLLAYIGENESLLFSEDDCSASYCANPSSTVMSWNATNTTTFYIAVGDYSTLNTTGSSYQGGAYSIYVVDTNISDCINLEEGITISEEIKLCNNPGWQYNLVNGLMVSGFDFTIDCNNASIFGNQTNGSRGISILDNSYNITLKNCRVSNFSIGLHIQASDTIKINSSSFIATDQAIILNQTTNSFISGCAINGTGAGLGQESSYGNIFYLNDFYASNNTYQSESGGGLPNNYCLIDKLNTYHGFIGPGCTPTINSTTPVNSTLAIMAGDSISFTAFFPDPSNSSTRKISAIYDLGMLFIANLTNSSTSGNLSNNTLSYYYNYSFINLTLIGITAGSHEFTFNLSDSFSEDTASWLIDADSTENIIEDDTGPGGGGGSGGAAPARENTLKFTAIKLEKGVAASFKSTTTPLPLFSIILIPNEDVKNTVTIQITQKASLPIDKTQLEGRKVYSYIEILHPELDDSALSTVFLEFFVEKRWLEKNNISESAVTLYRLGQDGWRPLETVYSDDSETRLFYSATSPGLSYFAISESKQENARQARNSIITGDLETMTLAINSTPQNNSANDNSKPGNHQPGLVKADEKKFPGIIIIIAIFSFIIVLIAVFYSHHKGKNDEKIIAPSEPKEKSQTTAHHLAGLRSFIAKALESGKHPDEIKHELTKIGWPTNLIEKEVMAIHSNNRAAIIHKIDNIILDARSKGFPDEKIMAVLLANKLPEDLVKKGMEKQTEAKKAS